MDPQTASVSEVNRHVRLSLAVFATLLALTGVTVAVAYVDLGHGANVAAALTIATVKASLVGLFFMHLKWERRKVHGLLLLTFFFFAGMIGLILGVHSDTPTGTVHDRVAIETHTPPDSNFRSE